MEVEEDGQREVENQFEKEPEDSRPDESSKIIPEIYRDELEIPMRKPAPRNEYRQENRKRARNPIHNPNVNQEIEFVRRPRISNPEAILEPIDRDVAQSSVEREIRSILLLLGEAEHDQDLIDALKKSSQDLISRFSTHWHFILRTLVECVAEIPMRAPVFAMLVSLIAQSRDEGTTSGDIIALKDLAAGMKSSDPEFRSNWISMACLDKLPESPENMGFTGPLIAGILSRMVKAAQSGRISIIRSLLRFLCELSAVNVLSIQSVLTMLQQLVQFGQQGSSPAHVAMMYASLSAVPWIFDMHLDNAIPLSNVEAIERAFSSICDATAAMASQRAAAPPSAVFSVFRGSSASPGAFTADAFVVAWQSAQSALATMRASNSPAPVMNRPIKLIQENLCSRPLPADCPLPLPLESDWYADYSLSSIEVSAGLQSSTTESTTLQNMFVGPSVFLVGPSHERMARQLSVDNDQFPKELLTGGTSVSLSNTDAVAKALGLEATFDHIYQLSIARDMICEIIDSHFPYFTDAVAAIGTMSKMMPNTPILTLALEMCVLRGAGFQLPHAEQNDAYYIALLLDFFTLDLRDKSKHDKGTESSANRGSLTDVFGLYLRIIFKRSVVLAPSVLERCGSWFSHYMTNREYKFVWQEWSHVMTPSRFGFEQTSDTAPICITQEQLLADSAALDLKKVSNTQDFLNHLRSYTIPDGSTSVASLAGTVAHSDASDAQAVAKSFTLVVDGQYEFVRATLNRIATLMGVWQRDKAVRAAFPANMHSVLPLHLPERALTVTKHVSEEAVTELQSRLQSKANEADLGRWLWHVPNPDNLSSRYQNYRLPSSKAQYQMETAWRLELLLQSLLVRGHVSFRHSGILLDRYKKLLRALLCNRHPGPFSHATDIDEEDILFPLAEWGSFNHQVITFQEATPSMLEDPPTLDALSRQYSLGHERQESLFLCECAIDAISNMWPSASLRTMESYPVQDTLAQAGVAERVSSALLEQLVSTGIMSPENAMLALVRRGGVTSAAILDAIPSTHININDLRVCAAVLSSSTWETARALLRSVSGELDSATEVHERIRTLIESLEQTEAVGDAVISSEPITGANIKDVASQVENETESAAQLHYFKHKLAYAEARKLRAERQLQLTFLSLTEGCLEHFVSLYSLLNAEGNNNGMIWLASRAISALSDAWHSFVREWPDSFTAAFRAIVLDTSVDHLPKLFSLTYQCLQLASENQYEVSEQNSFEIVATAELLSQTLQFMPPVMALVHDERLVRDKGVVLRC